MPKPKHLIKQWNTWYAVVYIPKDVQKHFVSERTGKPKTRFSQTLETDSLSKAEQLKVPYVETWKQAIKDAREYSKPIENADIERRIKAIQFAIKTDWDDDPFAVVGDRHGRTTAATELADHLDRDDTLTDDEKTEVFNRATGKWNRTDAFIDEWLSDAEYTDKSADEARTNAKDFAAEFRHFETVTRADMEAWAKKLLREPNKRTGKPPSINTVKKKVGHVKAYWEYCTENECTPHKIDLEGLIPKQKRTKSATTAKKQSQRRPWTVEDYWRLVMEAEGRGDDTLADFIRVGAHTGMRLEELAAMPLGNVKTDRFIVEDAKSEAGWREIPIHKDITQLVSRLVDTSKDGYLFSGLSHDNKYGKRGVGIGKRFGRLRDKLGYPRQQYVFHCFRKTLANLFMEAGVQEFKAALIVGHDLETMTYGLYGTDIPFPAKQEVMSLVSYGKKPLKP